MTGGLGDLVERGNVGEEYLLVSQRHQEVRPEILHLVDERVKEMIFQDGSLTAVFCLQTTETFLSRVRADTIFCLLVGRNSATQSVLLF